jgi:hypothetical protein
MGDCELEPLKYLVGSLWYLGWVYGIGVYKLTYEYIRQHTLVNAVRACIDQCMSIYADIDIYL